MSNLTDLILGFVFMAGVPGYFVLQPWALMKFSGGWWRAAWVPLLGAVPTIVWSLYALSQDSNLWPLTFIFFAPVGFIYLAILALIRRASLRSAPA